MTYETKEQSSQVTRKATHDEMWLSEQMDRINQDASEMGSDAGYMDALTTLVFELRRENQRLQGEAKVMRDLLGEAHEFLDQDQSGTPAIEQQIEAALRGAA